MPLYDATCPACGGDVFEVLAAIDAPLLCPTCRGPAEKLVAGVARTAFRWGDSRSYYDRGLGCEVKNHGHRQQIMRERGLVEASDLPSGTLDQYIHQKMQPEREAPPRVDPSRGRALIEAAHAARSRR